MDPELIRQAPLVAVAAAIGFLILAVILLWPVWRFLNREEEVSRRWTEDEIAKALRQRSAGGDGNGDEDQPEPPVWRPT